MKIRINGFTNDIELRNDVVNVLSVKNKKLFSHIISIINDKIKGIESSEIFLLDNLDNELKFEKESFLLLDIFNIEYNSKKILGKLYEKISNSIEDSGDTELQQCFVTMRKYIVEEINEFPFEFTITDKLNIVDILKLYNLKIDELYYKTLLEKIEFLIDLNAELKIYNLLIIPNLKIFLSEEEVIELYKYSLYNNINLLILETESYKKLKYEEILLIDDNFNDYFI